MYVDSFDRDITIEPVRKQVKVGLPPEAAFKLFTQGIGSWWPLSAYSVGQEHAETCFFEGWTGGRIMEVLKDGSQSEWGRVLVWEPYQRVSFHWYPGRGADTAQKVTITFLKIPEGTLVELVHSGWETLGDRAQAIRNGYVSGWDFVLARYIDQAV